MKSKIFWVVTPHSMAEVHPISEDFFLLYYTAFTTQKTVLFVHYHVHKSSPKIPILATLIHSTPSYFFKIYFNIILASMSRSSYNFACSIVWV